MDWIARHADGWLYYFVPLEQLAPLMGMWKEVTHRVIGEGVFKPFSQGMFFDLAEDPDYPVVRIHSGIRTGRNSLIQYLEALRGLGVNHVAMNLKASRRPAIEVLEELAQYVLPQFPAN